MAYCWNCFHESTSERGCWVCSQSSSKTQLPQTGTMMKQDDHLPEQGIFVDSQGRTRSFNLEAPTPSYLSPYTGRSARQSTDTVNFARPVLPKQFIESSNVSEPDTSDPMQFPTSRPYQSSVCDFDFSDDGGPVVSMIRTSGTRTNASSERVDPGFGSIEIIPAEYLPPREKEAPKEAKPPSARIDVKGWRRGLLVASVLAGMFLGFLDTTIVSVGEY